MAQVELWQQEAIKLGGESLVQVITDTREDQQKILRRLDDMDTRHKTADDAITKLNSAIANSDYEGHRRFHEAMIERNRELRSLRIAVQEKTISGLIWSAMVLVALAVWNAITTKAQGG